MKKDKEWLKERLAYYEREVDYGQYKLKTRERHNAVGKVDAINKIEKFVEEMDETEQVVPSEMETTSRTVSKKEIVEVPEFASFFIKSFDDPIYEMVTFLETCFSNELDRQGEITESQAQWFSSNFNTFCKACINGYSIEQPKLLTVIVKDYDKTIMSKQMPEDDVNKMMEGLV